MPTATPFGPWLKQQRKARGWTQKDLAEQIGCSVVTIEKFEAGQRRPSAQLAGLLAAAFAVPPAEQPAFIAFARAVAPPPRATPPAGTALVVPPAGTTLITPPAGTAPAAPWQQAVAPPHNLPAPATGLVGRTAEVAAVGERLRRPGVRLLTLTGPPGVGKTRLSLAAAGALLPHFTDGVFFVPLAPLRAPALVPAALAAALGVREEPGRALSDSLRAALRVRHLLLVLDNFEQLLPAAPLVGDLLEAAAGLAVLVTSRTVLRLYGEHEFPVPPLPLPDLAGLPPLADLAQVEAVRLFVERAQAADPHFVLTPVIAPAVAEICVRLDGLPLAIELAAARIRTFPPAALLAQMADRLVLLTGGPQNRPPRQQTLRAAIAWSDDLLSPPERQMFYSLSVFAGGCTIEAARAVAEGESSSSVPLLAALVAQHLLRDEPDRGGGRRFGMLETIREYAGEQLEARGAAAQMRRRHAVFYMALAQEASPYLLHGPDQEAWLARLELEHANLRAALSWALAQGAATTALHLGGALWKFWLTHGYLSEGRHWLDQALRLPGPADPTARATALGGAGNLAHHAGDYAAARAYYEEGLALRRALGDTRGIAGLLNNLAILAHSQSDYPRVLALHEESLALKRTLGDQWGIASSLGNLGGVAYDLGDYARARALHEESLAIRRALGDVLGTALALGNLGQVALAQGQAAAAQALHAESLALRRELGDKPGIAEALIHLGAVARVQGDLAAAGAHYTASLAICRALGDKAGTARILAGQARIALQAGQPALAAARFRASLRLRRDLGERREMADCLAGLAAVAAAQGHWERAARLFGATTARLTALGAALAPPDRAPADAALAAVRAALDPSTFAAAEAAGATLSWEAVLAEALGEAPVP